MARKAMGSLFRFLHMYNGQRAHQATQSQSFPSPRDRKVYDTTDGATFSSVRPLTLTDDASSVSQQSTPHVTSSQHFPVHQRSSLCSSTVTRPNPKSESKPKVEIRTCRGHEAPLLISMWDDAGISIGAEQMGSILHHLAPEGYLVAVSEGKILGACVNVPINDNLGMVGGLITDPACQGLGIARQVCFAGDSIFGIKRNRVNDAIPHMADTYSGWGYKYRDFLSAYYGGALCKDALLNNPAPSLPNGCMLITPKEIDFRNIMAFDRTIHPESAVRTAYMKWLIEHRSTHGYIALDADGLVCGMALATDLPVDRVLLGPVYAYDPTIAEVLFRVLVANTAEGTECETQAPISNEHATSLFQQVGLKEFAQSVKMYTRHVVPMPTQSLYGTTVAGYSGFLLC